MNTQDRIASNLKLLGFTIVERQSPTKNFRASKHGTVIEIYEGLIMYWDADGAQKIADLNWKQLLEIINESKT